MWVCVYAVSIVVLQENIKQLGSTLYTFHIFFLHTM